MGNLPRHAPREATTLLSLSLQHYRIEIRQRMMRHKQWIMAGFLFLLPGLAAFKTTVLAPLAGIFTGQGSPGAACGAALFVAMTAWWAGMQRDAVAYPPAAAFMASLPFSASAWLKRDFIVLAFASSPWLALVLLAFAISRPLPDRALGTLTLLGILLASFVSQLSTARGNPVWSFLAIATAALIGSVHRGDILALLASLNALLLWKLPPGAPWRAIEYRRPYGKPETRPMGWIEIHWRSLCRTTHGAYWFCVLSSIALTAIVATALHWGADEPIRSYGLLLIHSVLVTGLYEMGFATIFKNQSRYDALLNSLPTGKLRRAVDTIIAVELPAILLVLLLASSSLHLTSGPEIAASVLMATAMLCVCQYLIHRHLPGHATAASLALGLATITGALLLAPVIGI